MKQLSFVDDEHYVGAQRNTVSKRGVGPYFCDLEMIRIAEWAKLNNLQVRRGICHGARNGLECDELKRHFWQAEIFGTDLFPHSDSKLKHRIHTRSEVVEWNFDDICNEWIDAFDVVYSNSLDHSRDPKKTLSVWADQMKWNGAMFVQWNRSDTEVKGGDCFGADVMEYVSIMNEVVGKVVDLLYVDAGYQRENRIRHNVLECVVLVAKKKPQGDR